MIAQAIVESDWGQNEFAKAPYYNLFGLEGQYKGQSAMLDKKNQDTGATEKKEMKHYGSYKEAIQDYIEIIKTTSRDGNENYFSGTWRSNAKDYQTAAEALKGRFNDDQSYVQKLVSVIQENDLASYDATEPVTPPVAQPAVETPAQPVKYTVQSGDTVSSIAAQFGVSVEDLTTWNNVSESNIYAGQTIIVGNGSVVNTTPVETPVQPAPIEQNTTVDAPISNDLTTTPEVPADTSTSEQNVIPNPAPEVPQADQVVPEQPATETPAPETPAPEQPVTETPAPETPAPEQPATETPAPETPAPEQPATETPSTDQTRGQQIVNEAEKYIGTPYVWGGKDTSGFDCSGLTQYVYKQVTGKDIGVWTVAQESSGTTIDVSQAQQGDLLFWGDQGSSYHVAISAGGDQYIHAPQPGENVKYGSTQYYAPDFGVRVY